MRLRLIQLGNPFLIKQQTLKNAPAKSATSCCDTTTTQTTLSTSRSGLRWTMPGASSSPPELVEISRKAGVKAPEFIYLQEMERGVL